MSDDLEIELFEPSRTGEIKDELWAILTIVDNEFIPSLAARRDTTEHDLTSVRLWASPLPFFETVLSEYVLLATMNGEIVGFSSFKPHYCEELLAEWSPSTYISTTAVLPKYRRQGIARRLNERLMALPPELASPFLTRRTWSTNTANIKLIEEFGFDEVIRFRDHRGPGIDTLYFARKLDDEARSDR